MTGAQVLLLVVSESGLVYSFATGKLQPIVGGAAGKNLIRVSSELVPKLANVLTCRRAWRGPTPVPQSRDSKIPSRSPLSTTSPLHRAMTHTRLLLVLPLANMLCYLASVPRQPRIPTSFRPTRGPLPSVRWTLALSSRLSTGLSMTTPASRSSILLQAPYTSWTMTAGWGIRRRMANMGWN